MQKVRVTERHLPGETWLQGEMVTRAGAADTATFTIDPSNPPPLSVVVRDVARACFALIEKQG